MTETHRGTCFCGAVEVKASGDPIDMGYCHCMSCRTYSGAPFSGDVPGPAFAAVRAARGQAGRHGKLLRTRAGLSPSGATSPEKQMLKATAHLAAVKRQVSGKAECNKRILAEASGRLRMVAEEGSTVLVYLSVITRIYLEQRGKYPHRYPHSQFLRQTVFGLGRDEFTKFRMTVVHKAARHWWGIRPRHMAIGAVPAP